MAWLSVNGWLHPLARPTHGLPQVAIHQWQFISGGFLAFTTELILATIISLRRFFLYSYDKGLLVVTKRNRGPSYKRHPIVLGKLDCWYVVSS